MQAIKCAACGLGNFETATRCRRCGAELTPAMRASMPSVAPEPPVAEAPLPPVLPLPDASSPNRASASVGPSPDATRTVYAPGEGDEEDRPTFVLTSGAIALFFVG